MQLNFLTRDYGFKLSLVLAVGLGIQGMAYGQDIGTFGYQLVPGKMLENTQGILEVNPVQNGVLLPQQIQGLTVRSSDPSIIQVIGVEENQNGIITDVKIKAGSAGTANIALIAPGFPTAQVPITIYSNQDTPAALILNTSPSSFSLNGPTNGYVSAELVNSDGYPVIANKDTVVTLSQNDNSLLNLKNDQLVIKRGDYFAIGEFNVMKPGTATIFANSESMSTVSSTITIDPDFTSSHLQLYLYPSKISSSYSSHSYAIVQLQDANGNPVKAKEDIFVSLSITGGPQQAGVSSSPVTPNISAGNLVINKGSYWGYSTLTTLAGVTGSAYSVGIAANNYPSSDPQELDLVNATMVAQTPAQFDPLPILATGQDELIGVLELVDANGTPIMTNGNLVINIDSTDRSSLFPKPVKIEKGSSSELVFARTGFTAPSKVELYDTTDNSKLTTPTMYGPDQGALNLVADPLVPQLLPGMSFPLLVYMLNANTNSSSYFPDDTPLSIANNGLLEIQSKTISQGQGPTLLDAKAVKVGSTQLAVTVGSLESDPNITILSPRETQLQLLSPSMIISNTTNRFSLQLLDANGLPVPSEQDMKVSLISNAKDVISVPQSVTIKKGDSYALFDSIPNSQGSSELTLITDGLPLVKSVLQVSSLTPTINIFAPDSVNATQITEGTVNAMYNSAPLSGLKVDWGITGAKILTQDSTTDKDGNAKIKFLPRDAKFIVLHSTISGGVFGTTTTQKMISIGAHFVTGTTTNPNLVHFTKQQPINYGLFFFIIPVAGAISLIVLKKKGKLGNIEIKKKAKPDSLEIKNKSSKKAWLSSSILPNLDELLPKQFNKEKRKSQ